MKSLLEEVLHEFNTLHGLWATDGFGAYGDAQRDGYGTNAAWDVFKDGCFRLDVLGLIEKIESTLSEPLLVDELAKALKGMLTLPYRPLRSSSVQAVRIDMVEANAKAAVSRYQQEVGDA